MASVQEFINGLDDAQRAEALRLLNPAPVENENAPAGGAGGADNAQGQAVSRFDDAKVPKLPFFSGVEKGSDVPYLLWKFEIQYLLGNQCPENMVQRAIHRSVKGTAAKALCHMGDKATSGEIVSKFDKLFGNVTDEQYILSQFHSATQESSESVTAWGCRLEGLLADSSTLIPEQKTEHLRSKFWDGLRDGSIKNAIRHRYDNNETFEALLAAARNLEKPIVKVKLNEVAEVKSSSLKDLENKISEMSKLLNDLNAKVNSPKRIGPCFKCGQMGHLQFNCKGN